MRKGIILLTIFNLFSLGLYSQNEVISIDPIHFNKDTEKKIILINKDIEAINTLYPNNKESVLSNGSTYTFSSPLSQFKIGKAYQVIDTNGENYDLYFTQLPIINISTDNTIVDEPRVYAHFTLCENNGDFIENAIGIEYRGGWTQSLPKKSLRIEFWNDMVGDDTKNITLLGMRSDDDWNIQAMYNEPLRIRSKANYDLWGKIDKLYYSEDEPEAINGVRQEYVELFINDKYSGIYALSERVDRKQLKLKKFKDDQIRGELYKGVGWGASTFTSIPQYNNNSDFWSGFERKHPDDEINWANIYEFVDFVINEDDFDFYQNYRSQFNIDNAVNYFIFLNLLRATDNTGKNLYIGRYNIDEPYFYIPWDLDGTFGMIWNGTQENITDDILTNGFYKRLILDQEEFGFTDKLKKRWKELRDNIVTIESIIGIFNTQFNYLESNGVYERELRAWEDSDDFLDTNNIQYTSDWLESRLDYLDNVFNNPRLFTNTKIIYQIDKIGIKIFPNPASNYLNIEVSDDNIMLKNISILNSLGQCLMYCGHDNRNINVSGLNNGLYFVIADFENGYRQVEKFIIEK